MRHMVKKRAKVLIVEDDVDLLATLTDLLESEGLHVIPLRRAKNVESIVQTMHPAIALVDVQLPDGRGDNVAKKVKQINGTKVYLMSASEELHRITKESGADGYIRKPFGFEEVLKLVH